MNSKYNSENSNVGRPTHPKDLVRISLHVPRAHYRLLKALSAEEDLSVAQIVRRAIELYLTSQSELLNFEDIESDLLNHVAETRSKKAILLNHTNQFSKNKDDNSLKEKNDEDIFSDLNPDAF